MYSIVRQPIKNESVPEGSRELSIISLKDKSEEEILKDINDILSFKGDKYYLSINNFKMVFELFYDNSKEHYSKRFRELKSLGLKILGSDKNYLNNFIEAYRCLQFKVSPLDTCGESFWIRDELFIAQVLEEISEKSVFSSISCESIRSTKENLENFNEDIADGTYIYNIYNGWCGKPIIDFITVSHSNSISETKENIIYKNKNFILSSTSGKSVSLEYKDDLTLQILNNKQLEYTSFDNLLKFQDESNVKLMGDTYSNLEFDDDTVVELYYKEVTVTALEGNSNLGFCINAKGTLTIKSTIDTTLIINSSNMSSCIGEVTHLGLSYNRWESCDYQEFDKLILDGVHLVCNSKVPNFSLGAYGEDWIPEIVLLNGATITAPDVKQGFKRVMLGCGECYQGSTKRTGEANYEMVKINEDLQETNCF